MVLKRFAIATEANQAQQHATDGRLFSKSKGNTVKWSQYQRVSKLYVCIRIYACIYGYELVSCVTALLLKRLNVQLSVLSSANAFN